jgi:hypothetical protein
MLTITHNGQIHRYYYTSPEALSTWLTWLPATGRNGSGGLMVEKPIGMPRWLAFLLAWLGITIFGA